jgi:alpha-galactosidase
METLFPLKLQGLDANRQYRVKEINLMPGKKSELEVNDKVYSGDYLMKIGLNVLKAATMNSAVLELTAE